jgi:hypothetical protein
VGLGILDDQPQGQDTDAELREVPILKIEAVEF